MTETLADSIDTAVEPTGAADLDIVSASAGAATLSVDGAERAGELAAHDPPSAVQNLAARLRCTEGQLYSMVIGLLAAIALVLANGVPLGGSSTSATRLGPTSQVTSAGPARTGDIPNGAPLPSGTPQVEESAPPPAVTPGGGQATAVTSDASSSVNSDVAAATPNGPSITFPARIDVPPPGQPRAVASDGTWLFAGTDNSGPTPSQLLVYTRAGELTEQISITGQPKNHTGGLTAAAIRGTTVLVADRSDGDLIQVDPQTGRQQVLATIPNLPPCVVGVTGTCQPGAQDQPPTPEGLVVTGHYAYVSDAGQGTIWRYDFTTQKMVAWYSSSDFSATGPSGLAIDSSGSLIFTVSDSGDSAALLKGALYRLAVASDGTASTRTLVATFAQTDNVGPVTVGPSGDIYVARRGAGGVAVVRRAGTTTDLPRASVSALPAPTGLSLVDNTLLVADAGKPATPTSGRVIAVPIAN